MLLKIVKTYIILILQIKTIKIYSIGVPCSFVLVITVEKLHCELFRLMCYENIRKGDLFSGSYKNLARFEKYLGSGVLHTEYSLDIYKKCSTYLNKEQY